MNIENIGMISDEAIAIQFIIMNDFTTGSGGALKSNFTLTGTSGPTIPLIKTLIPVKRNNDPASSYIPHKYPVPSFIESRERQKI